ncbi:MAG: PilZ domain-containing protein [Treponema sp.]|jgi:AmiR/NasT family two-component response regulator|nr:PilZ domain-containing protein [Treponema sp.]
MKLLLALDSDDTRNLISLCIRPLGFDIIRYHNVLKAMDNIEETDPSAIIISARDFPRHWKIMVQFVRSERPKDLCPIILLKGDNFPLEETSKAFYLGVSGIVDETLDSSVEIDRLQSILSRYIPVDEKRKAQRYQARKWQRLNFIFASPRDKTIVTGEVKTISSGGVSFHPDHAALTKDMRPNMELAECSLRAGGAILSPLCRVIRTGRIVSLEFLSFPKGEQEILDEYLENLPLRDLKYLTS